MKISLQESRYGSGMTYIGQKRDPRRDVSNETKPTGSLTLDTAARLKKRYVEVGYMIIIH
jgi:hypothetical protein